MEKSEEEFNYYQFRITLVKENIDKEISFYEKSDLRSIHPISDYVNYLKGRIASDSYLPSTIKYYDKSGNMVERNTMDTEVFFKDMDIKVFKKPWSKLRIIHKILKVKEFIGNLQYRGKLSESKIKKNKKYLIEEISDGLKNKKFVKNKSEVDYDEKKMVITSISCLAYNKKKDEYEIDWDE